MIRTAGNSAAKNGDDITRKKKRLRGHEIKNRTVVELITRWPVATYEAQKSYEIVDVSEVQTNVGVTSHS